MTTANNSHEEENIQEAKSENTESQEMSMEALLAEQDEVTKKLGKREIVKVKVIQITQDNLLVDVGEKKEGIIPVADFENEKYQPEVGSEVTAVLVRKGGEERHSILSHTKALEVAGWVICLKAMEEKTRVKESPWTSPSRIVSVYNPLKSVTVPMVVPLT